MNTAEQKQTEQTTVWLLVQQPLPKTNRHTDYAKKSPAASQIFRVLIATVTLENRQCPLQVILQRCTHLVRVRHQFKIRRVDIVIFQDGQRYNPVFCSPLLPGTIIAVNHAVGQSLTPHGL